MTLNKVSIIDSLRYNKIFKFFTDNNFLYPLHIGFRQKYSKVHAPISLTVNIRKNLDEGNISCVTFVDTVEHYILLSKLELFIVQGLANNWSKSNLSNRN